MEWGVLRARTRRCRLCCCRMLRMVWVEEGGREEEVVEGVVLEEEEEVGVRMVEASGVAVGLRREPSKNVAAERTICEGGTADVS